MPTNVYVDGFNLYYGCLSKSPYKWLDLGALCGRLMPRDQIHRIRYFTAKVAARGDPQTPIRQQVYLRALETIPNLSIHYGHFLTHPAWMKKSKPPKIGSPWIEVIKTEEKGSDVNLATFLLLDAFKKDCDTAVVISNDSDLKLPIEVAQQELGIAVGVINPHPPKKRSHALQPTFFNTDQGLGAKGLPVPSDPYGFGWDLPEAEHLVKTQRPATRAGLAPSHRSGWGDMRIVSAGHLQIKSKKVV